MVLFVLYLCVDIRMTHFRLHQLRVFPFGPGVQLFAGRIFCKPGVVSEAGDGGVARTETILESLLQLFLIGQYLMDIWVIYAEETIEEPLLDGLVPGLA